MLEYSSGLVRRARRAPPMPHDCVEQMLLELIAGAMGTETGLGCPRLFLTIISSGGLQPTFGDPRL